MPGDIGPSSPWSLLPSGQFGHIRSKGVPRADETVLWDVLQSRGHAGPGSAEDPPSRVRETRCLYVRELAAVVCYGRKFLAKTRLIFWLDHSMLQCCAREYSSTSRLICVCPRICGLCRLAQMQCLSVGRSGHTPGGAWTSKDRHTERRQTTGSYTSLATSR